MTDASIRADLGDVVDAYVAMRRLPDGRIIGIHRLIYHWTLHVGIGPVWIDTHYCYWTLPGVAAAFTDWNGEGDPQGWHRHPDSGRRRNNATGVEWNDADHWRPEHTYKGDQPE